jgi:lipopolysaccharide export system protein LptA
MWKEPSVKISSYKITFACMLAFFFCVTLLPPLPSGGAADTPTPQTPASGSKDKKIHITADRLISDSAHNNAEFIGNVHARQGNTLITADRLKIFFGAHASAVDASPTQSLKKLVATGNVKIKFDNRLAVARQAVYITDERKLILTGPGATVTSGDNTITGETITFYRADGRFTVEGGSNGRVNAVILPEKKSGLE